MPFDIASSAAGAIAAPVGSLLDGIFGISDKQDQRQQNQTRALQDIQLQGAKNMTDYNYAKQLQMWKDTNYSAQIEQMDKAGVNPAMIYGKGGAGGATTGSGGGAMPSGASAGDPNAGVRNSMEIGMQIANMNLIKAQTAKTEAEAAKIQGVDTQSGQQNIAESQSRQQNIDFQNAVNKAVGVETNAEIRRWDYQLKGIEFEKENAAWETFKAAGYPSNNTGDPNSPAAKAVRAGLDKTVTDLENAKKQGNILEAQTAIEGFKAELAKQGIPPDSPWFVKIISDMLERVQLNPIKAVGGAIKEGVKTAKQYL